MTIIYYEGERICFRPIEVEDEAPLRRWINDPRIWSTMGCRQPINGVRERETIESFNRNPSDWIFGIALRGEDRLIGTCGLHAIDGPARRATLGLMIGESERRGQGYGTEATRLALRFGFEELNLHRIELSVFEHNPAGIRAYEKAGFELEGRLRQRGWRHGRWRDELRYAILRERWERLGAAETRGAARVGSSDGYGERTHG